MASLELSYGSFSTAGLKQPVPDISLNTSFNFTPAGHIVGSTVNLTLNGVLFATGQLNTISNYNDGITNSYSTSFSNLLSLMTGFQAAFSKDYEPLSIKCNGIEILPDNCRSNDIKVSNFSLTPNNSDPNMLQSVQYSVEFIIEQSGSMKYITGDKYDVSSIQNSYSIENLDTLSYYGHTTPTKNMYPVFDADYLPTYRITRILGATGKDTKEGALFNAKRCVSGLISYDTSYANVLNNLTIFERSTSIDFSEIEGTYTITDNSIAISGNNPPSHTETFTINHSMDENLKRTATINGTIQGIGSGWTNSWDHLKPSIDNSSISPFYQTPQTNKYLCASGAFDTVKTLLYSRILACVFPSGINSDKPQYSASSNFPNYTGIFNPIPASMSIDHNLNEGSISYNYAYDTRPVSLITGALSENLSVEDTYGVKAYAQLPVLWRRPIFQDLGTSSSFTRTATYDAVFPAQQRSTINIHASVVGDILDQFNPNKLGDTIGGPYIDSKLTKDDTNIDIQSGRYNRSKTWIYQKKKI